MVTNSTFYTDSNGRDFLKRVTINLVFLWLFDMINLLDCYYFFLECARERHIIILNKER
jgi:hypothetical protein